MVRLLPRLARWSLPAALVAATLVAVLGLGGVLFPRPTPAPPGPAVALNLTSAPALPVPDDGAVLTPQQVPGASASGCPDLPHLCPPSPEASEQAGCCR